MEIIKLAFVEDDLIVHESLLTLFSYNKAFEVVLAAKSVEELLQGISKNGIINLDIVLMDIGLPGKSGLEGIIPLKEKLPGVDVVMFTTYEEEDKIFTALCNGASSYISKRSSLAELVAALFIVYRGGSYMSPSIARKVIQHFAPKKKKESILTDRQKEIVKNIVEGLSYQEVADRLFISIETVRSHIKRIYKVLHINGKAELIRKSIQGDI